MSQRMNYNAASPTGMKALGAVHAYIRRSGQVHSRQPRLLALANGQLPARPNEMTGVAAWMLQEIVLMLRLGFPEVSRWYDLGHDLAGPQPGFFDVRDRVFRNPTLFVSRVIDR
jgi:hypothetical protein